MAPEARGMVVAEALEKARVRVRVRVRVSATATVAAMVAVATAAAVAKVTVEEVLAVPTRTLAAVLQKRS